MSLINYWHVVFKRKSILIICLLSGIFAAIVFNTAQKPVYRSKGEIEVKMQIPEKESAQRQYSQTINEIIATECKIITSYPIIKEAAESLNIISENNMEESNKVIEYLKKNISADRIKGTNIIQITSDNNDPHAAASMANRVIQIYINKKNKEKDGSSSKQSVNFKSQLAAIKNTINTDKAKLLKLTDRLEYTENTEVLETILFDLKLELTKLLRIYNYNHPDVIDLKNQIEKAENQIGISIKKNRLLQSINNNEEKYNALNYKLQDSSNKEVGRIRKLNIITPAIETKKPIRPNKKKNIIVGALMGILFGFLIISIVESKEFSLKDIEDFESKIGIPVMGIIPNFKRYRVFNKTNELNEIRNRLLFYHSAKSSITEAYFTLWTNVKFALPQESKKTILFASTELSEGKTLTTVNYAIASAMAGMKTLLIEADSVKPVLSKLFSLPTEYGLNDIVLNNVNWKDSLQDFSSFIRENRLKNVQNLSNLKIITYGKNISAPMDVFNSKKLDSFIDEVKQMFDLVIFDSSPILLSAESVILSAKVDNVVLVHKPGIVPRGFLNRVKVQFENVHANILGIVLNNVKVSKLYFHKAYYPGRYLEGRQISYKKKQITAPAEKKVKKVLIIDDENSVVNVITRMLLKKSKYNYEITSADNGYSALRKLESYKPHLIILDLKMPGIDGYEVCEKIRSNPENKNIKIMAVTGYDEPEVRERIINCGADEYLTKPFDLKKFLNYVDNLQEIAA